MAMGDVIGRLSVVLGLDTAAFETGAKRAAKTTMDTGDRMEALGAKVGTAAKAMVGFGAAIAGSQLVNQIKDMAIAGLEHASALGEQAQQLGVTTGELQRYRYIATQVGIDQEAMDKGLAKLSLTLGDLANGAKAPTEALQRLGFNQQEIARVSKMTAGEAIPILADAFSKLKSPTEAASIAADLFGSKMGGKFLTLLMGGRAGVDDLTQAFKDLGLEISEGQIAKADEAMDKLAALQEKVKAKQAQVAVDNADGLLAGLNAWEELKTKAIVLFGQIIKGVEEADAKMAELAKKIPDPWEKAVEVVGWVDRTYSNFKASVIASVRSMYEGVKLWLQTKLGEVWDWLGRKINWAKDQFYNLYDAVVGHSYIPDMVDGIADEMQRLDQVMVKPIQKGTDAAKEAFKQFQTDVQGIMGNLFPDAREIADFRKELATLDRGIAAGGAGGYTADQLRAGRQRLIEGAPSNVLASTPLPLADQLARFGTVPLGSTAGIQDALGKLAKAANDNSDKIGVANVRIADSFKEMADKTLSAINQVVGAVKGGSFLDILSSVINLGLQLGSIGAFGKNVQTRINTPVPGYASGTSYAPGGLAMVGERGPELVNLPRGSQVIPNHALRGGSTQVEVIPSPYFDVRVQQNIGMAAPGIAQAGARAGEQRIFARQRRKVA